MPYQYCDCKGTLPYHALRWVRAFGPRMRAALTRALLDRQSVNGHLSAQDFAECIATAWAMLEADAEMRVVFPPPDPAMVERAREDAKAGRGRMIDAILNDLS